MLTFKEKKDHNNKVALEAIKEIHKSLTLWVEGLEVEGVDLDNLGIADMDQGYFVEHINNGIQRLAKKSQDATDIMNSRIKK